MEFTSSAGILMMVTAQEDWNMFAISLFFISILQFCFVFLRTSCVSCKKNYVQTRSGRVVQIKHAADETLILKLISQRFSFFPSYTKVVLLD